MTTTHLTTTTSLARATVPDTSTLGRDEVLALLHALVAHPELDRADVFDALKSSLDAAIAQEPDRMVPTADAADLEDAIAKWRRCERVPDRAKDCLVRARGALTDAKAELMVGADDAKDAAEKLHTTGIAMRRAARGFLAASRTLYTMAGVTPPAEIDREVAEQPLLKPTEAPPTTPEPSAPGVVASLAPEKTSGPKAAGAKKAKEVKAS